MEYCKLQVGCLLIVAYITYTYIRDRRRYESTHDWTDYNFLLGAAIFCIIFDGTTAVTVNHLDTVNATLNLILHLCFLLSIETMIFAAFVYVRTLTRGYPSSWRHRILVSSPYILDILLVILTIGKLEYRIGETTNYSMGIPVYICFSMVAVYLFLTLVTFIQRWNYIERHKRINVITYLLIVCFVTIHQFIDPESLITSIATTFLVIGAYTNQENPAMRELNRYQKEMVMSFATLVENKDDSTGEHIRRTTTYVKLLADELRERGYYTDILTKEYTDDLVMAAPMHDIGKISVPDAILQKPDRLTKEEFDEIKEHTVNGSKIIQDTFGRLKDDEYLDMAYNMALNHHEKWNGKGYPHGLSGEEIPLCARIMSIADVFDAVSEDRCYRPAMPLEECFDIIEQGRGTDFDPLLVDVFLSIRDKVEAAHDSEQE